MYRKGVVELEFIYSDEFIKFLESLRKKDKEKMLWTIERIEEFGVQFAIRQKWVDIIEKDLYEVRSQLGNNIQRAFYFQIVNDKYYVTHGFTKKTQKTPSKEIRKARAIREEYWETH